MRSVTIIVIETVIRVCANSLEVYFSAFEPFSVRLFRRDPFRIDWAKPSFFNTAAGVCQ